MKPYTNSTKVSRTARRQPSHGKSSPEDDLTTRKVLIVIEQSSNRPVLDHTSAINAEVWQQRPVWSLDPGENIIRILPPYDKNRYVYEEIPHHWGVGPNRRGVICRQYIGKRCFICEVIEQLWRSEAAADWELARRMALNPRYFYNVLNVKDSSAGVLVWGTSEVMTF